MRLVNLNAFVGLIAIQSNRQLGIISNAFIEDNKIIGVIEFDYEIDITDSSIVLNLIDTQLPSKYLKIRL